MSLDQDLEIKSPDKSHDKRETARRRPVARLSDDYAWLLEDSRRMQGGLGAVAYAMLEMFRRGGLDRAAIETLHGQMEEYFAKPSNDDCNSICKMVYTRLEEDREPETGLWYSEISQS